MNSLYSLIFPSIALISGFMSLVMDRKYFETNKEILNKNQFLITPLICVFAAILMILIALIDESFYNFHGMIFGAVFGGSFCLTAFWHRKVIENFFEKIDTRSNS
jgi:hypothetical protein